MPLLGNWIGWVKCNQFDIGSLAGRMLGKPAVRSRHNDDVLRSLGQFSVAIGLLQIPLAALKRRNDERLALANQDAIFQGVAQRYQRVFVIHAKVERSFTRMTRLVAAA